MENTDDISNKKSDFTHGFGFYFLFLTAIIALLVAIKFMLDWIAE